MEEINDPNYKILNIDGVKYKTLLTRNYLKRKPHEAANPKLMFSFIPGNIVKIYVGDKKKVKKGEKLLVLEAMKMNNEILAPFDGVIKKMHVSVNDHVTKSQLLIEFK